MADNLFDGKVILVTGGTGSFGKQFIRTMLSRYKPHRLIVLSRDELKQYEMQQEFTADCMRYFLGDIRDEKRVMMAMNGVDYVVHAAALKQVPALEYNPGEAVETNIRGSQNVAMAAIEKGVSKVIALSTDKAAAPINLYGATKLVADKLFIAANNTRGARKTQFAVVRYGNVIGSRGSVVPLFQKMLAEGATELPITDAAMTRFWITLPQGVDFVIKCFERMQGGELFVPKIPSTRVIDLATAMAPDAKIKIVGIRPGEKLHEVMCPAELALQTLEFDDHYVIEPAFYYQTRPDYAKNGMGQSGKRVAEGFEYNSLTNPQLLTVAQLKALLQQA
ncbi:MAG: UDP-N-acetylglucosamine 4,6-dehydratase (inverting) [Proteobacteria bacterium]|nr:UDP-N-acetylglucosamine 4,6-dehydratase (inverting) [Pseudomonadota bacterium]